MEKGLTGIVASPKVAIMGCVVNGPGEAKEADIGIAGGDGKGADFHDLREPVARFCRAVILLGRDAGLIAQALGNAVPLVRVATLDEAVRQAAELAREGDAVLLSPACASLDMFKNFEERGRLFAKAVEELA